MSGVTIAQPYYKETSLAGPGRDVTCLTTEVTLPGHVIVCQVEALTVVTVYTCKGDHLTVHGG